MKKKILAIIFISSLILLCCKKKDDTPQPTPTPSNTSTTGSIEKNYAVFSSKKHVIITNTFVNNYNNTSMAYVSDQALINNNPIVGSLLDMGNVSLNGTIFKKNSGVQNMYQDSTFGTFNTPLNWIIAGSISVGSFIFSNTDPYPTYTGYTEVLDSFIISQGITIPLIDYTGCDEIETHFASSISPYNYTSFKYISGQPTSINFTAQDLSTIGVSNNVSLNLTFYKNNVKYINGKNYNFRTGYAVYISGIKFK